ncbi:ABC transporter ATP-binding protein [Mycolicibacterium flavescens]|uniref:Nickel import system ATP-binding protein NikD n=1 Tax=Mycolicibacterium flavescens TaxID=1776 RepID=A0A1E3RFU6_MYCFV|nr:ATP-binding cassette domain-containing protein [Mycolicibacterium flavescens]MCV7282852.1 ABC transporter ATP-binding protein [Mycolicibacterium flavescens]ODQ88755.1 ABC transporter [Mycolicibacterium flavescens]
MDIAAQITDLTVDIAVRGGRAAPVVRVLDGADLALPAGDVTALIGESGCGKSLVALALCGLLPASSRISGRITIGDDDMSAAGERAWRQLRGRRIGLVPQSAATSFTPVRTVGSQVAEVCRRVNADRTAEQLFAAVRLPGDVGDRYPHELSGGMAQRAAIAAALAGRPELLIADEPTSALDPDNAATVWGLLAEAAADGAAVLVITHDLASLLAADACGQVALMRDGAVLRQGPVVDLLDGHDEYAARFFDRVPA